VLARQEVADGGLDVGPPEVGLCERDAVSAIAIDDYIEVLG